MFDQLFIARLIEVGRVRLVIEFAAPDPTSAWVEMQPKPESQGEFALK